jgi:hypothetical protein
MNHCLGVVCRDHVRRGTERGVAQLGHGKRDGLAQLAAGDWLVYYSPRTSLHDGEPLQAFTALVVVADDETWQAHEGACHPWRCRVDHLPNVVKILIRSLGPAFSARPGWDVQLRRGLVRLTDDDFSRIHEAMRAQQGAAA